MPDAPPDAATKPKLDLSKEVAFFPEKPPVVAPKIGLPSDWSGDLLALALFEDALKTEGDSTVIASSALQQLDASFGGLITELITLGEFTAKKGTSHFARLGKGVRVVGIVGLGPKDKALPTSTWGPSVFETLGSTVATTAKAQKAKSAAVAFVDAPVADILAAAAGKIAQGALLGGYEATRFKAKPTVSPLQQVDILLPEGSDLAAAEAASQHGQALASGTLFARYLVEAPPNICTPQHLADAAKAVADGAPDVFQLTVLEKADCEKMGMGLYLGVTACSELPPKFIHLVYKPAGGGANKVVGLVGKGLTFDSGGYNLKVGGMIEMMKFDMGGCAAVLGAAQAISKIRPPGVEIHFISAACENMIDGKGMRPGDILQAANGKTVEIGNTDAEGRLTLADALWYAQEKCGVSAVLDIATLTGAQIIALGDHIAAFFTPSDELQASMQSAAQLTGEKYWRMPLEEVYWESMKSPIADMKNVGGRVGGCITAALFVQQYVDVEKVQWGHIDIAGPAWLDKQGGATGFGASTLAEWAILQGK